MPTRLVVVGGSDAGISAGLRARELDPTVEVTLVVADAFPNFSICGIPYWISGEVTARASLAHRTRQDLEVAGLNLRLDTVAERIDVETRELIVRGPDGTRDVIGYDRLVVGTGAVPVRPPIPGIDVPGVCLLHSMGDATAIHDALGGGVRSAVVIGAGYIGLEMADGLTVRGIQVTLIEQAPAPLTTVAPELGALVLDELTARGVRCAMNERVTNIARGGDDRLVVRDSAANVAGFDALTVAIVAGDHKAYYPGASPLHLRIVGDREHGQLLGAQILGRTSGQVSKRIDTLATAIYHRMTVAEVSDLDLSYPPLSSPWDPVQIACQAWECARRDSRQPHDTSIKELA